MSYKDISWGKSRDLDSMIEEGIKLFSSEPIGGRSLDGKTSLSRIRDTLRSVRAKVPNALGYLKQLRSELIRILGLTKKAFCLSPVADRAFWITRISVHLAYIWREMESIFPDGTSMASYHFMNSDANQWWTTTYGDNYIVDWSGFLPMFTATFSLAYEETELFQETICMTSKSYVSAFTFDVFVCLFQPWSDMIKVWRKLVCELPGYVRHTTFDSIRVMLAPYTHCPGTYVYRMSCSQFGRWVVASVDDSGSVIQTICNEPEFLVFLNRAQQKGTILHALGSRSMPTSQRSYSRLPNTPESTRSAESTPSNRICNMCGSKSTVNQMEQCRHYICYPCRSNQVVAPGGPCPVCAKVTHKQ